MIAVKIEIGISDAVALLAKVSMTVIKNAPRLMLTGITLQLLFPRIILEICGTKSPTQPTCPHMDTQDAVIMDDARINATRRIFTFTPRDLASSSLNDKILSL